MPTLRRVLERSKENLKDRIWDEVLEKLASIGIVSDRDLILREEKDIYSKLVIRPEYVQELISLAVKECSAVVVTGDSWQQEKEYFSTGCREVDNILEGGLLAGEISEFAGPSGSGKTQLAFYTLLNTLITRPYSTAMFIDTVNCFSANRLETLLNTSEQFKNLREPELTTQNILSRIHHIQCFDAYSLLAVIEAIGDNLSEKSGFYGNLCLIVIDCISTVFAPLLSFSQSQGHALMAMAGRALQDLCLDRNIVILLVNGAVGVRRPTQGNFVGTNTRPALGATWAFMPSTQLYFLQHEGDEQLHEDKCMKRICEITRCRRIAADKWCYLFLDESDISSSR
ncbi:uncharacterized protein VTP21DRAFT_4222 [Calcarisporiella thermophila]|uniref:uncharacterized protein n=1 Tax=Calcarisporiella thermophila TaxID=911321 RepID=UPI003744298E